MWYTIKSVQKKRRTSFTLSKEALEMLGSMSKELAIPKTSILELLIRVMYKNEALLGQSKER